MRCSLITLLFFGFTILSCHENSKAKPAAITIKRENADTLTIDKITAVFYQPDSLQVAKRMAQTGEESFRAGMDDYIYYINTSAEFLQKQGLPVIDAKNKKYLRFVSVKKKDILIKLDTLKELWGIYFFDPVKAPYSADITDIETEYENYYHK